MRKRKKKKLSGFERKLLFLTIVLVLFSPFATVCASSMLSKANYEVEVTREEVATQEKSNESLQMKINELASLENLQKVAKKVGLSYTSNSVKTIE
jgi:cell division protein FtsL